jgi:hypothetical protein
MNEPMLLGNHFRRRLWTAPGGYRRSRSETEFANAYWRFGIRRPILAGDRGLDGHPAAEGTAAPPGARRLTTMAGAPGLSPTAGYLGESSHGVLRSRNAGSPTDSDCISSIVAAISGGISFFSPSRASASDEK